MRKVYKTTFKLRRGKAESWEKNNPILQEGEPGFALDTNILKIGDGKTGWLDLKAIGAEGIASDEEIIDILIEEDMLFAITDSDGSILADENENILTW